LAASVNTSAFNVGNAIGPALGAAVIALGWGFTAPVVVAIVLAVAALGVAAIAIRGERRFAADNVASASLDSVSLDSALLDTKPSGDDTKHSAIDASRCAD
ncbi:MAG: Cmx/CmrA family chloramphenicol efflux MFS transporter, partial [Brevibacterium aurantiacum]|nr:Cmx/CmrA family chloramphenicol efflux MFS transporter [Brevibacterium aurantiacum]